MRTLTFKRNWMLHYIQPEYLYLPRSYAPKPGPEPPKKGVSVLRFIGSGISIGEKFQCVLGVYDIKGKLIFCSHYKTGANQETFYEDVAQQVNNKIYYCVILEPFITTSYESRIWNNKNCLYLPPGTYYYRYIRDTFSEAEITIGSLHSFEIPEHPIIDGTGAGVTDISLNDLHVEQVKITGYCEKQTEFEIRSLVATDYGTIDLRLDNPPLKSPWAYGSGADGYSLNIPGLQTQEDYYLPTYKVFLSYDIYQSINSSEVKVAHIGDRLLPRVNRTSDNRTAWFGTDTQVYGYAQNFYSTNGQLMSFWEQTAAIAPVSAISGAWRSIKSDFDGREYFAYGISGEDFDYSQPYQYIESEPYPSIVFNTIHELNDTCEVSIHLGSFAYWTNATYDQISGDLSYNVIPYPGNPYHTLQAGFNSLMSMVRSIEHEATITEISENYPADFVLTISNSYDTTVTYSYSQLTQTTDEDTGETLTFDVINVSESSTITIQAEEIPSNSWKGYENIKNDKSKWSTSRYQLTGALKKQFYRYYNNGQDIPTYNV